jgi:hypothetical protein
MDNPVIVCEFGGVTRDGREIVIRVAIGEPFVLSSAGDPDPGFFVEVEPLMRRTRSIGTDSFMAMCFGIELVRKALKIFVAHGGAVYFRGTRSPIDLESYWFESLGGLLRKDFLQDNNASQDDDEDQSGRPGASEPS